jgi:hypothetical protein
MAQGAWALVRAFVGRDNFSLLDGTQRSFEQHLQHSRKLGELVQTASAKPLDKGYFVMSASLAAV